MKVERVSSSITSVLPPSLSFSYKTWASCYVTQNDPSKFSTSSFTDYREGFGFGFGSNEVQSQAWRVHMLLNKLWYLKSCLVVTIDPDHWRSLIPFSRSSGSELLIQLKSHKNPRYGVFILSWSTSLEQTRGQQRMLIFLKANSRPCLSTLLFYLILFCLFSLFYCLLYILLFHLLPFNTRLFNSGFTHI